MDEETTKTETPEVEDEATEVPEDFDPERALRTIRAQREAEKRLKSELAELKAKADEFDAIKAAEEEAQKTLAEKLAEKDAELGALKARIAEREVRDDFARKAAAVGITDIDLAYLAAKEQGLLGKYDPKTGAVVGDHDFDTLAEKFPSLVGTYTPTITGDAGVRGAGKSLTTNERFNRIIREQIRR